jgi:hypothetical protein
MPTARTPCASRLSAISRPNRSVRSTLNSTSIGSASRASSTDEPMLTSGFSA